MASRKKQQQKNARKNRRRQNKAEQVGEDEVQIDQDDVEVSNETAQQHQNNSSEDAATESNSDQEEKSDQEAEDLSDKQDSDKEDDVAFIAANDLRKGGYVLMNNSFPCKVVEMKKAKTGKHGGCKIRVIGLDVLTTKKHEHIFNSKDQLSVPSIRKIKYEVAGLEDNTVQLNEIGSTNKKTLRILPETNEVHAELVSKFRNRQKLVVTVVNTMNHDNVIEVRAL
eukprot:TRINITY_DN22924_c0_g1_i1.p1 TRINITY_DN22924_c0_g1~~TRINITY_DN22924_c0_g1_i1.p1  ORF type:complete len:225 (-),score=60.28 TRINITY_DN22924_c0_g1_i1:98-772(-)